MLPPQIYIFNSTATCTFVSIRDYFTEFIRTARAIQFQKFFAMIWECQEEKTPMATLSSNPMLRGVNYILNFYYSSCFCSFGPYCNTNIVLILLIKSTTENKKKLFNIYERLFDVNALYTREVRVICSAY